AADRLDAAPDRGAVPAGGERHAPLAAARRAQLPAGRAREARDRAVPFVPHRKARRAYQRVRDTFPGAAAALVVRLPDPDPAGPRDRLLPGADGGRDAVRGGRAAAVLR